MRYALVLLMNLGILAKPPARFQQHVIASDLKGGYQVLASDLNNDGKPDLIAVASGLPELIWFENPGWQRHVLASGRSRMINLAVADAGPDGISLMALAEDFAMDPRKSLGKVSLLTRQGDPRAPWLVREIDRLPASHRLKWADVDGTGRKVLINAPLAGSTVAPPEYKGKVPIVFYRPGEWKRELLSEALEGVLHGICITDWDRDGREELLTASFLGIHLFRLGKDGLWRSTELTKGSPAPWPKCGASEVAVGQLGRSRFLCSIEPWHGNQVVLYTQKGKTWRRQVLDDTLAEGHTIQTADLNGDGRDEIIVGFRGKPYNLYVYSAADAKGTRWSRQTLDEGGMGAASCAVADLNGDGRPDLACISSTTLKWYENVGGTPGL